MKNKNGQQATEFLLQYGWAILSAIIVIGILGYYYFSSDVLNPKQEESYDLTCLGEKYCEDIGLEFQKVILYNDEIICKKVLENMTEIEYNFGVTNKTLLMEKYPEC